MKMSKDHTTQLWNAVIDNDYTSFNTINTRLLNAPTALKHIPIRIYLPLSPSSTTGDESAPPTGEAAVPDAAASASFRVVQSLVHAVSPATRKPQSLGQALKGMMPTLFPSTRDPVLATVILHGAPVPFEAPLEELMREVAYPDGWLCFVVMI
jgi:autophagy-related protein 5